MSGRCRSCGRTSRSRSGYGRRHYRRHRRTVFSQVNFWVWVLAALGAVWILSDLGVIK